MTAIHRLATSDELLARIPDSIYLRAEVVPGITEGHMWASNGAVAFVAQREDRAGRLVCIGEPTAAVHFLPYVLEEFPFTLSGVILPRGAEKDLPLALRLSDPDHWELWWTDTPPPAVPGEERVSWLDNVDDEIQTLLDVAYPAHRHKPGDHKIPRWAGIRDSDGSLVACGAEIRCPSDIAGLVSVTVHPHVRKQGLGTALEAWVTRRILSKGDPLCTVSTYMDNTAAHRLVARLGYRNNPADRFTSATLVR